MATRARRSEREGDVRRRVTYLFTLQGRVVLALVLFADDAQLGEVAQLWVDGELTELIVRLGEEVRGVCTSCDPVQDH